MNILYYINIYLLISSFLYLSLGGLNVFAASLGTVAGGLLTSKLKLGPKTCLKIEAKIVSQNHNIVPLKIPNIFSTRERGHLNTLLTSFQ